MRLSASAIALVVGLLVNPGAQASELPQRWVSAGGALSEWVMALGGESKLVGVDTTSQHPDALKALPSIGYQRQLSAEGILSLRPQVLVGTEEMGPPPVLAQIRGAGVQVEMFSAQPDLPTLKGNLQHLGKLLGTDAKANELFTGYEQALDQQKRWVANAQSTQKAPGVLLLLGHAGGKREYLNREELFNFKKRTKKK
jgi:iron complex transport system substrate-binding protein